MASPRRHLSMLRSYTPADLLTIGNAACGTIAIFLCLDYVASGKPRFLWSAFVLLPLSIGYVGMAMIGPSLGSTQLAKIPCNE